MNLVQMVMPGQVQNRPNLYAGQRHIDNELTETGVPVLRRGCIGATEQHHEMAAMPVAVPEFGPIHPVALRGLHYTGSRGSQIGAGIGLAQTDTEKNLPARHS